MSNRTTFQDKCTVFSDRETQTRDRDVNDEVHDEVHDACVMRDVSSRAFCIDDLSSHNRDTI
jgi:hypothetical protein